MLLWLLLAAIGVLVVGFVLDRTTARNLAFLFWVAVCLVLMFLLVVRNVVK